ncbi:DUF5348 domain-containing protein [Fodinisporobacter ferrooxydans]
MTRTQKPGILVYCPAKERWQIQKIDHSYDLHCGDCFEIKVGYEYIPCRIELGCEWLLYLRETRFYLHPKQKYEVKVD